MTSSPARWRNRLRACMTQSWRAASSRSRWSSMTRCFGGGAARYSGRCGLTTIQRGTHMRSAAATGEWSSASSSPCRCARARCACRCCFGSAASRSAFPLWLAAEPVSLLVNKFPDRRLHVVGTLSIMASHRRRGHHRPLRQALVDRTGRPKPANNSQGPPRRRALVWTTRPNPTSKTCSPAPPRCDRRPIRRHQPSSTRSPQIPRLRTGLRCSLRTGAKLKDKGSPHKIGDGSRILDWAHELPAGSHPQLALADAERSER